MKISQSICRGSKFLLLNLFFILFSCFANGQTFQELITEVNDKTKTQDNIALNISLKAFELEEGNEIYRTSIHMKKSGDKYYYKMEDIEIVSDGQYQITANHDFKIISLFNIDGNLPTTTPEVFSLDSILHMYTNPVKIYDNSEEVTYRVKQNYNSIKEILITINKAKRQIKKIVYEYNVDPGFTGGYQNRVEMDFSQSHLNREDDRYFDIYRYFKKGNSENQLILDESYKDYSLEKLN